ncbi:hypothetical protein [Dyadobacter sp. CY326]|uniref:tetratricopeptide repeat protein n=1 Tax=Dyadobacter sp. CY326 TaxID=2907300 RepID=UPI001F3805D4|nr:hypothetical protein [Dyadobacter sp. CY326]MCE7064788.1 hypothetical protein [Dyadobacter sp. CY326]
MKGVFNWCLFFTCLLSSAISNAAEFDNLINKSHPERYTEMRKFINMYISEPDSTESYKSVARLKAVAIKHNDRDLILEAELARIILDLKLYPKQIKQNVRNLHGIINKAAKEGNMQIVIRAHHFLARLYWYDTKNYERAFDQYLMLHPLLQKVSGKEFPEKAFVLTQIGEAYYFFADYRNAVHYSREALTVEVIPEQRGVHNIAHNTIGLSYIKLGRLDSADYYFDKILKNLAIIDYNVWKGIAQGDLGLTAYLRGNYERAKPLLQANIDQAVIIFDFDQAARSLTLMADIYIREEKIPEAEKAMLYARQCVVRSQNNKPLEQLYQVFGKVYAAKGNLKLTNVYLDSANRIKNIFEKDFNSMQMLRASEKAQLNAHRADMERVAAERQIKTLERNILLVLVLLLGVMALYFYKTYYYKNLEKQRLVKDQLEKAEQELTFATMQLEEFTRSISEKTQLVEELSARYGSSASDETVQELQKITILTDEQWEYFRNLFEKIHVGYLSRLREKLPGLTPAEVRFMALARLNLTYKEMASTLGISVQSVRVIRHRIRKKLNLPEEADLKDVISTI